MRKGTGVLKISAHRCPLHTGRPPAPPNFNVETSAKSPIASIGIKNAQTFKTALGDLSLSNIEIGGVRGGLDRIEIDGWAFIFKTPVERR